MSIQNPTKHEVHSVNQFFNTKEVPAKISCCEFNTWRIEIQDEQRIRPITNWRKHNWVWRWLNCMKWSLRCPNHSLKLWKFTLPQVVYMLGVHWKPQELNGGCANIPLVLVGNNFLYSIVTGDKTCVLQQVCLKANNSWCNVSYTLSSHKEIQNIKLYQKNKSWQVFWDPKGYTFGWFLPQGTTTTT